MGSVTTAPHLFYMSLVKRMNSLIFAALKSFPWKVHY